MKVINKPVCIVSCPIDTYSGYGARSRDLVESLIRTKPEWDVKILPQRWGNTRWGYLKAHDKQDLLDRQISKIEKQPEVWIQITVPNEFQKLGKYNIGVTAGIETTICSHEWIQGINRMDLLLVSSNFTKETFVNSKFTTNDGQSIKATVDIQVLFEGVDTDLYDKIDPSTVSLDLNNIEESSVYLVVGHWMKGKEGHDRKNMGTTVRTFLEAFKNKAKPPALLLKTQQASASITDRGIITQKINDIRNSIKAGSLPNVYVLHGDLTDTEINELYNHPKVKAMVSLTKGEGFGRPLLEFSTTGKPIIASGWSGVVDFLKADTTTLIPGTLEPVDSSVVDDKMFMKGATWFKADTKVFSDTIKTLHKNPKPFLRKASSQRRYVLDNFSIEKMDQTLGSILLSRVPEFPKIVELDLPKLQLPKLKPL